MIDAQCSKMLASLLSTSNRNAVLGIHDGTDKVITLATQLSEDYEIMERLDSCSISMRLKYARILHNHGSLNEAVTIQQSVLHRKRQNEEKEDPRLLIEALRSYAWSLMALGNVYRSRDALEEALDICEASPEHGNMHALDCKRALAALLNLEGSTTEAIKMSKEVLRAEQESSNHSKSRIVSIMSDLAVYLAIASHWEESWETISGAKDLAEKNLRQQDAVNLSVDLNASTLSGVMRLPEAERSEQIIAAERGGRVIAIWDDERIVRGRLGGT